MIDTNLVPEKEGRIVEVVHVVSDVHVAEMVAVFWENDAAVQFEEGLGHSSIHSRRKDSKKDPPMAQRLASQTHKKALKVTPSIVTRVACQGQS